MIVVDHVILSDEIAEEFFVCDLQRCKGACCEEGDLGAPLEPEEVKEISHNLSSILPYLSPEGRKVINEQGLFVNDHEGDISTPTIKGKACAYSYRENGVLGCGIERAWKEGKSLFRKPVSCHLYPIRINRYDEFEAVNYHRWQICSPACSLGTSLKVPLYRFLKEALIRKYGEPWYGRLCETIEASSKSKQSKGSD